MRPYSNWPPIAFVASEDSRDVEVLKKAALQRMALDYRDT
jgi:hypothetical protein